MQKGLLSSPQMDLVDMRCEGPMVSRKATPAEGKVAVPEQSLSFEVPRSVAMCPRSDEWWQGRMKRKTKKFKLSCFAVWPD